MISFPGDDLQYCGGFSLYSVYVAECENTETRYGEYCYTLLQPSMSVQRAIDECSDLDSHLIYPNSIGEIVFIEEHFSLSEFHVGYRHVDNLHGVLHTDNSIGLGMSLLSSSLDEGSYTDTNCVYASYVSGNLPQIQGASCADKEAVCRKRLGSFS